MAFCSWRLMGIGVAIAAAILLQLSILGNMPVFSLNRQRCEVEACGESGGVGPTTAQEAVPALQGSFPSTAQNVTHRARGRFDVKLFQRTSKELRDGRLYYLHIPKTGTSFETVITAAVCPELHRVANASGYTWGLGSQFVSGKYKSMSEARACAAKFEMFKDSFMHNPYSGRPGSRRNVITMIRDPYERIVSGYFDRFHSCPHMQSASGMRFQRPHCKPRDWNCNTWTKEEWRAFVEKHYRSPSDRFSIAAYARCVAGCQANMLTGRGCGQGVPPRASVDRAVRVVGEDVAFVGLTERFDETVQLWAALWAGSAGAATLRQFEAFHVRHSKAEGSLQTRLRSALRASGFKDSADEAVHKRAVAKFEALREAAGLL